MPSNTIKRKKQKVKKQKKYHLMEAERRSLEILNDDCLLKVFSYLNMRDLFVLATMCQRFRELVQLTYPEFHVLDVVEEGCKSNRIARKICSKIGPYVHTLRVLDEDFSGGVGICFTKSMLSIILRACPNIEELDFCGIQLQERGMMQKFDAYVKKNHPCRIRKISFQGCFLEDTNVQSFKWLEDLKQLEMVDLSHNRRLEGKCLMYLEDLREMCLEDCRYIEPDFFIIFCKNNLTLTHFNIRELRYLNQKCVDAMAKYLKELKVLRIDCEYFPEGTNLNPLKKIPGLKCLDLEWFAHCNRTGQNPNCCIS